MHILCRYPLIAVQLTLCTTAFASDQDDYDFGSIENISGMGEVITPSRMRQNIQDVPASTTVITRAEIIDLGFKHVPEILRLVPGMSVAQAAGNDYRVSYHGGVSSQPRRVNVLIDGISIYRGGLARIDWASLPITVDDIRRIEVVRSPSGASYGANSFQAVVNILTQGVEESAGLAASASIGPRGHRQWRAAAGTERHNVAVWNTENDGFDTNFEDLERRDDLDTFGARYSYAAPVTDHSRIEINIAAALSELQVEFADARQQTFPDKTVDDYYFNLTYVTELSDKSDLEFNASHSISKVRQEWRSCYENILFSDAVTELYAASPQAVQTFQNGGIPVPTSEAEAALIGNVLAEFGRLGADAFALNCGDVNQDFDDTSTRLEAQFTSNPTSNLQYVVGLGLHRVTFDSETYIGGVEDSNTVYAFSNASYSLGPVTLNAGVMVEHYDHLNDDYDFSYRGSASWHIDKVNTVRLAYMTGTRTPDLFETERNWGYVARNLDTPVNGSDEALFLGRQSSSMASKSEEIRSTELAYIYDSSIDGLTVQSRVFYDQLNNLNSTRINISSIFSPVTNSADLRGFELESRYRPTPDWSLGLGYAYLDTDTDAIEERDLAYKHSGFVFARYRLTEKLGVSAAYYGSNNLTGSRYDKVTLTGQYQVNDSISSELTLMSLSNDNTFTASSGFVVENNYKDSLALIFGVKYRM